MILWGTPHQKASSSSSKSLIIKPPEFCSLMKPGNVGVAEATARLLGYISGQKGKAWVVKDLGLEPLESPVGQSGICTGLFIYSFYVHNNGVFFANGLEVFKIQRLILHVVDRDDHRVIII